MAHLAIKPLTTQEDTAVTEAWEEVELPPKLSAIVIVNIRSHAAGRRLWEPTRAT